MTPIKTLVQRLRDPSTLDDQRLCLMALRESADRLERIQQAFSEFRTRGTYADCKRFEALRNAIEGSGE